MLSLLRENRVFEPGARFREQAIVNDEKIYKESARDSLLFWERQAGLLHWFKKWDTVLEWEAPYARWFTGGKTNACYNCVDRHLETGRGDKAAIIWEGEPGDSRIITYSDLYLEVSRFAVGLKSLGVQKGDRVVLYLPMIPELPVALLACARIGAVHSVVFAGFSPGALGDRINDCGARVVVTADGGWRRGKVVPLKNNCDTALEMCPGVEKVVVVNRTGQGVNMRQDRDLWYHDLAGGVPENCDPEPMDPEDMLFILYTSGTTGKPKGIIHTTGGYLTGVSATHRMVFDIKYSDVYWCTADIGWITGHSYVLYGPLCNGSTVVIYEGSPDYPEKDRFWYLIERYGVTILYTSPTAVRTFMKWGTSWLDGHNLGTLRLLGTVGEPINPEAWMWLYRNIGGERCPIVDTWWQTETGMIMVAPLPGITKMKPGSATRPFPGVEMAVVDEGGRMLSPGNSGFLAITSPWPAMLRGVYGDPERYVKQYWSEFQGMYSTGDVARLDEDGYIWVMGRADDVINVSGHRLGTMEIESALVEHPAVAEAAVIGRTHDIKGQALTAFVSLKDGYEGGDELERAVKELVVQKIGALARPEEIYFTPELPKTRSQKIMRRLLRDIAEGRTVGDATTLSDPEVLDRIKEDYQKNCTDPARCDID